MKLSYQDLFDTGRKEIEATVTTEHSASSYGLPVVLLEDGGLLSAESWVLLGYSIVSLSKKESPMMEKWLKNLNAMMGMEIEAGKAGGGKQAGT